MSKKAAVLAGIVFAVALGILLERLIVTDREAIEAAGDRAAAALARRDVEEAVKVLHRDIRTDAGDFANTRRVLEDHLAKLPLERVEWLNHKLEVKDGVGTMTADVFLHPDPKAKSGVPMLRLRVTLEWVKDGEEWKIRRAAFQQ